MELWIGSTEHLTRDRREKDLDRIELEKLVRTVVVQVLTRMLAEQSGTVKTAPETVTDSTETEPAGSYYSRKHLITETEMRKFVRDGITTLTVATRAIVTPAAQDYASSTGIQIQRGRQEAITQINGNSAALNKRVAVLAPRSSRSEKAAVIAAVKNAGFEPDEIADRSFTTASIANTVTDVARQVAAGNYAKAIILHEDTFRLSVQADKIPGIQTTISWDTQSVAAGRVKPDANILLMNNYNFGLKTLNDITRTWLTS